MSSFIDGNTNTGCGDGLDGRVGGIVAVMCLLVPFAVVNREIALVHQSSSMSTIYNILLAVSICVVVFYLIGYALSNGFLPDHNQNSFVGERFFFLINRDMCAYIDVIAELARALTTITIVLGAATERIHTYAVTILTICITAFIYSIPRYWTAGDNSWLLQNGRMLQDTAGNGSMFFTAGLMALILTLVIRPRNQKVRQAPFFAINNPTGLISSTMMGIIGSVFMIAFSSSRRVSIIGDNIAVNDNPDARALKGCVNIVIAGALGGLSAVGAQRYMERKQLFISPQMHLRIASAGILSGIVSVSSFATVINPELVIPVAMLGGVVCHALMMFLKRKMKDDATDASAIYLGGGVISLLAAPFWDEEDGIFFHGGKWHGLGWNLVCMIVCLLWVGSLFSFLCLFLSRMRVLSFPDEHIESEQGLDVSLFSMDVTMLSQAAENRFGFHAGVYTPAPARGRNRYHQRSRPHPHDTTTLETSFADPANSNTNTPHRHKHMHNRKNNSILPETTTYSPIPEDSREGEEDLSSSTILPGGVVVNDSDVEI
eukprot:m.64064 g.64064  ORF g.64064 m.64064 type:complete len:544 (-) comp11474_c2_seq2:116-1747(-)